MALRRVRVGCDFTYVAEVDTPVIFQVTPADSRSIAIGPERWTSEPLIAVRGYRDLYGNSCVRAVLPAGRSSFGYETVAICPDAAEDIDEDAPEWVPDSLPDETLLYILPSRYCLPDLLGNEAWARTSARSHRATAGYRRSAPTCTGT